MANVFVSTVQPPRIPRNDRIYGGNSFNTTNKYTESEIGQQIHRELGIIYPSDYEVEVVFNQEFTKLPVGMGNLKVYRWVEGGDGYVNQDVLFSFASIFPITTTGFSLTIHSSESLAGVIIEYYFTE